MDGLLSKLPHTHGQTFGHYTYLPVKVLVKSPIRVLIGNSVNNISVLDVLGRVYYLKPSVASDRDQMSRHWTGLADLDS